MNEEQLVVTTAEVEVSTELKNIIEALIFASDEPMTVKLIRTIMDEVNKDIPPSEHFIVNAEIIRKAVGDLNRGYGRLGSGFRIIEIGGGYTYATQEQFSTWVGKLAKEKARRRLSPTAVETLAIIAYKQPIAKGEVEFIRGVNVDYIINALLEKDLIHITGRAPTPGRPLLYGTTQKFLEHFGLNEITDLPKPREIEELIGETELEVDRRLLAEQQELEFKQDLENKLDGNEGSKNKPQKTVKVKVPDEVKAENLRSEKNNKPAEHGAVPIDDKKVEEKIIEEGELSSENNLVIDEATAAPEAGRTNEAAIPENEPEIPLINDQDRLVTGVRENQDQSPDRLVTSHETSPTSSESPAVPEMRLKESEPELPAIDEHDRLTTDLREDQTIVSVENQEISLESPEAHLIENVRESPRTDEAAHSERSTEDERQDQAQNQQINSGTGAATGSTTGWSKWKNKVKTFFQKLFA